MPRLRALPYVKPTGSLKFQYVRGALKTLHPLSNLLAVLPAAIPLLLILLALSAPQKAQGQTYYWGIGYTGTGAACVPEPVGPAQCATAQASCQSIAATFSSRPSDYFLTPSNQVDAVGCNYWRGVNFALDVFTYCPGGLTPDANTPSGCVPTGAQQYGKSIGGGFKTGSGVSPTATGQPCQVCSDAVSSTGGVYRGEPINVATGNVFYAATDYTTAGQNPLTFTRYYNSRSSGILELGVNWRSNFDRTLWLYSSSSVTAQREDGQMFNFTLTSGVWTPDSDVDYTLSNSGSTWTLTGPDDTAETYTTLSDPGQAQLNTIAALHGYGYTQTMTYNSNNELTAVTDSYNRTLTLTYGSSPNLLQSVITPEGNVIRYGYTDGGSSYNLTSVTFPTSPATTFTYNYASTIVPNGLTSITNPHGNTTNAWAYDAYGRGVSSTQGSGSTANVTKVDMTIRPETAPSRTR